MTDQQILDLLREALEYADPEKARQIEEINMDATLADLGVESVASMEMAGFIEEKLDILFPDDEMAAIASVEGFAKLIRRYTGSTLGGNS